MDKIKCDEDCFNCPYTDCICDIETRMSKKFSALLDVKLCGYSNIPIRLYKHHVFYRDIMQNDKLFNRPISVQYGRYYYLNHRAERLNYGKDYYRQNRERCLKNSSDYYYKNAERKKEYQREYYKLHKDEINFRRKKKRIKGGY